MVLAIALSALLVSIMDLVLIFWLLSYIAGVHGWSGGGK